MTGLSRDARVDLVERSGLFDMDWYVMRYGDVAQAEMHPVWHYLKYGVALGRDPGPGFETGYYLRANADVAAGGMNPLLHYLLQGRAEGRAPTRLAAQDREGAARVDALRDCLWGQGLAAPARAALAELARDGQTPLVRGMAAWELAIWQLRAGAAAQALELITRARAGVEDVQARCRLVTLEQMAFDLLDDRPGAMAAFDYAESRGHVGPDAVLARANMEPVAAARLAQLNRVFATFGLAAAGFGPAADMPPFDRLEPATPQAGQPRDAGPKVSVLIAAYKARATLGAALHSLCGQTWGNLEILVIDDASPDGTATLAHDWAARDARIRVLALDRNLGAYGARNRGLAQATGDYVTLMDADDWAHPARIERHVAHMEGHPDCIASTSQQVRAGAGLTFRRWTGRGDLITRNTASVFFRRQAVIDRLGGWDTVRVAADSEMIRRMGRAFGDGAVAHLETGPLTVQRDHAGSAVADPALGIQGVPYGARRAYLGAQLHHHARADSLRYDGRAPFAVPAILRGEVPAPVRVVLAADLSRQGAALAAAQALTAGARAAGMGVGLVHWPIFDPERHGAGGMDPALRDAIDGRSVQELTFGETVDCDLMLMLDVGCLAHLPRYLPRITARRRGIVLHPGETVPQVDADLDLSGALWLPTGEAARDTLAGDPDKTVWRGEWREDGGGSNLSALQQLLDAP